MFSETEIAVANACSAELKKLERESVDFVMGILNHWVASGAISNPTDKNVSER